MLADKLPSREMILAELEYRATHRIESFYPTTGPLRRELYRKHMDFFEAGARHNERLFLSGNRVGKSEGVGAYECVLPLTGKYPAWWRGRRFAHPVAVWAAGKDAKTTRDIPQLALLGSGPQFGTGMLPADTILGTTPKPGVPEGVETVYVRHISGGRSELQLKSYDSGVESFYGTKKHVCWLDEECEPGIYSEVLMRTLSTVPGEPNGIVLATLTPLWGMTALVRDFLEAGKDGPKYFTQCTWDEAPHLSHATREELWKSIPSYQRDARTRGIPQLGSGAIYKFADEDILVRPFPIPDFWPRCYGLDVGWNKTAAIWGARDPQSGVIYLYSEYYRGQAEPQVHVEAIKQHGPWIPGVIDPASRGRSQKDGSQLLELYKNAGLDLEPAANAVEAGIFACEQLFSGGMLKAFTSLSNWYSEFRMYRRDQDGRVVKEFDHLLDAMRYLILSGRDRMTTQPRKPEPQIVYYTVPRRDGLDWMAR